MTDEAEESLYEVLDEVLHLFPRALDFAQTSAESLPEIVDTLSRAAVIVNMLALHRYGGRMGPPRSNALVEQVVGAAFQAFAGFDPHPDPFDKAAMLLRGIIAGHPFGDGNKRTGFMVGMYYLERVGIEPRRPLPKELVVEFCRQISAGEIQDVQAIKQQLAKFWGYPTA